MSFLFVGPAIIAAVAQLTEQQRFKRELEETQRAIREFDELVRTKGYARHGDVIDLPPDAVREVRPSLMLTVSHPFDREIERVAGYPCFADSDGGECD